MSDDHLCDPQRDPFKPPAIPTEVFCMHCHQEYDSYLMHWEQEVDADGRKHGFWCCPTPGCDGRGFGFDILPTDQEWTNEDGQRMWCNDESDDEESEIWEYIYSGETPRLIDPQAEPTPDEDDPDLVQCAFDEFGEPIDEYDDRDESDDDEPFDIHCPPKMIDPWLPLPEDGNDDGEGDDPRIAPFPIGPIYVNRSRDGEPSWEDDIPF